jgi:multiple sugar transport system ATP-binding protein
MNFLRGDVRDGVVQVGPYALPAPSVRPGGVLVGLRPEDFVPATNGRDGVLPARVELTEQLGPEVLVHITVDGISPTDVSESESLPGTLVARLDAGFHAARGDRLDLVVQSDRMQLFDPETGASLTA